MIVSLAFLDLQVRQVAAQVEQTARNQRASIRSERASRSVAVMIAGMSEPAAADAIYSGTAGSEAMTLTQIRQFSTFCLCRFTNAEDAFHQNATGLLDEAALLNLRASLSTWFTAPGFRASWQFLRPQFHGDFVAFIDNLLAETQARPPQDEAALWTAAFAAEKAKALATRPE